MFINIFTRFKRAPLMMLAVILFAAVLVMVLCGLQRNIDNEIAEYEETYSTIPVTVRMCDLKGEQYDNLSSGQYVYNVFTSDYELGQYLKDSQFKTSYNKVSVVIEDITYPLAEIAGITSIEIDGELAQRRDNVFAWYEGYDESVLRGEEPVCVLPQNMLSALDEKDGYVEICITRSGLDIYGQSFKETCTQKMRVVGSHAADQSTVYCPFLTLVGLIKDFDVYMINIAAASAIASDNYNLEELRNEAYEWFAQPNGSGEKTPWDYSYFVYYPTALEIDDSKLVAATEAMENSIKINRLCAYIVLALSAVAGFFAAFLSIRSRKREITLMRSLGNSGFGIFMGYTFEQLVCLVLGTAIGGAAFRWQPIEQIGMFLGIYFLGLALALIIFVSRNLLSGQKEDE